MVEYESFEDALKDLGVNEDELKRMVSEGSLRAYRDNDKMKFRKDDIENLKRSNLSDIGSAPSMTPTEVNAGLEVVEETDETILDLGDLSEDIDFEDTGETSVPTVDISGRGSDTGGLTGELVFDEGDVDFADADATIAMDEGLTFDDGDLGLETEPIDAFADDNMGGGEELDLEGGGGYDYGGAPMGYMPMAAPQIQVQERIRYVEILSSEGIVSKIISFVFLVVMILTLAAFYGATNRTDALGLPSFGWSMNMGPNSQNSATQGATVVPMSGDQPMKRDDANWTRTSNWAIAGGANADNLTYAGIMILRDNDVRPNAGDGSRAARANNWYTVADAVADDANNALPSRFDSHTVPLE